MDPQRQVQRRAAIDAVRAAAAVCQKVRRTLVHADSLQKQDRSPVTVADFAAQAVVGAILGRFLPADSIVAEEQSDQLRSADQHALRAAVVRHVAEALPDDPPSERRTLELIDAGGTARADGRGHWALDPLDGTKGFLRGEQYAVALARLEGGEVTLAVLACPNLEHEGQRGVLLVAGRGEGTRCLALADEARTGVAVHASTLARPAEARFCESVESGHSSHDEAARVARLLGISAPPVRMDSQAKYAAIALGQAQIYLRLPTSADYREKIWDHAAGTLVVAEAGGRASDIRGQPLQFTHGRRLEANQGIIATNGPIHDLVVGAVARALAGGR